MFKCLEFQSKMPSKHAQNSDMIAIPNYFWKCKHWPNYLMRHNSLHIRRILYQSSAWWAVLCAKTRFNKLWEMIHRPTWNACELVNITGFKVNFSFVCIDYGDKRASLTRMCLVLWPTLHNSKPLIVRDTFLIQTGLQCLQLKRNHKECWSFRRRLSAPGKNEMNARK